MAVERRHFWPELLHVGSVRRSALADGAAAAAAGVAKGRALRLLVPGVQVVQ